MWQRLTSAIRKGLIKIGLLKALEKITDHKDISLNEEMFDYIETWKDLYKGYHAPFHDIKYKTIDGWKERRMDTLMMAKTVASEMASLVYNEKCGISIDNETVAEFIEDVFKKNKFNKKFQDFLEYSFAHGGMVIKPYIEDNRIMLSFVTADSFIPISWKNDSIYEAVFPFEFKKRDKKFTHLEWHLWEDGVYVIRNEVYESLGSNDLGTKVPLRDYFPNLEEEVFINGLERSIFSHFKPNSANNIDLQSPLGISIFANALDTMKAIDAAFDSFNREFRLGKKRIIVPAQMVKSVVDPESGQLVRYFDPTDEVYEAFPGDEEFEPKDISVELRVDEHIAGINALLNFFAMQTGFSSGTFTFDGKSMKTATEVVSEQSKTFKSKQSHEVIIEAALQELIGSIVAMGELYKLISVSGEYEVTVSFDDSIAEDRGSDIKQQTQMILSGIQSKKRAIMRVHQVTEKEAEDIIKEIEEEQAVMDPINISTQASRRIFGDEE